eukprot:TRINITY_DN64909_c0_g1_i1.p1 TRINITY_DN64909_c0_g1~~TRINITY_DN64909_c0_g1_i1.p1  ORF type:complete len:525 (+),score=151.88 TRINITY_DN64909_c0_g1_i1:76-1575(+)
MAEPPEVSALETVPDVAAPEEEGGGEWLIGTIKKVTASGFGFIAAEGMGEIFVHPAQCGEIGHTVPPVGTAVYFQVEEHHGRQRATNVYLADYVVATDGGENGAAAEHAEQAVPPASVATPQQGGWRRGTLLSTGGAGKFGFIRQEGEGEPDMFVLPASCGAFGGDLPPIGTELMYTVTTDSKTGRQRADVVRPFDPMRSGGADMRAAITTPPTAAGGRTAGGRAFAGGGSLKGGGGAGQLAAKGMGTVGLRNTPAGQTLMRAVSAGVLLTGHVPDAAVIEAAQQVLAAAGLAPHQQPPPARLHGTMVGGKGSFGFIEQDDGGPQMFVMPMSCVAWGGQLPPKGTRLTYIVVTDEKSGRPRADDVRPEPAKPMLAAPVMPVPMMRAQAGPAQMAAIAAQETRYKPYPNTNRQLTLTSGKGGKPPTAPPQYVDDTIHDGVLVLDQGKFGFIRPSAGGADMFVIPGSCGGSLPPLGTRVNYRVVTDATSGRHRAEDVTVVP